MTSTLFVEFLILGVLFVIDYKLISEYTDMENDIKLQQVVSKRVMQEHGREYREYNTKLAVTTVVFCVITLIYYVVITCINL